MFLPSLVAACAAYRQHGVFNCLLSDGDWLFSFCSTKLARITRRAPFGPAQLKDADVRVDFQAETTPADVVTVLATEPLTDNECWNRYLPGEWRLWRRGECVAQGMTD
jgi:glutamine amidotransferase